MQKLFDFFDPKSKKKIEVSIDEQGWKEFLGEISFDYVPLQVKRFPAFKLWIFLKRIIAVIFRTGHSIVGARCIIRLNIDPIKMERVFIVSKREEIILYSWPIIRFLLGNAKKTGEKVDEIIAKFLAHELLHLKTFRAGTSFNSSKVEVENWHDWWELRRRFVKIKKEEEFSEKGEARLGVEERRGGFSILSISPKIKKLIRVETIEEL